MEERGAVDSGTGHTVLWSELRKLESKFEKNGIPEGKVKLERYQEDRQKRGQLLTASLLLRCKSCSRLPAVMHLQSCTYTHTRHDTLHGRHEASEARQQLRGVGCVMIAAQAAAMGGDHHPSGSLGDESARTVTWL